MLWPCKPATTIDLRSARRACACQQRHRSTASGPDRSACRLADDIDTAYGRRILGYREIIRARTPTHAEARVFGISEAGLDQLVRFDPIQLNTDLHRDGS
jgi:hypothetical protein